MIIIDILCQSNKLIQYSIYNTQCISGFNTQSNTQCISGFNTQSNTQCISGFNTQSNTQCISGFNTQSNTESTYIIIYSLHISLPRCWTPSALSHGQESRAKGRYLVFADRDVKF